METIKILHDDDILDELSLEDIKGGAETRLLLCCIINSNCNKNEAAGREETERIK